MNPTMMLELLDRVLKSWWTVVAGLCVGLSLATVALDRIPKTYEAGTTIFVIPQTMPENLVRTTVTDDMSVRLRSLREAMLSRPYMLRLVTEIFGENLGPEDEERMIRSIQGRAEITLLRIDPREGGGMFRLAFRDNDPVRAAEVVNLLARLYIDQNIQFRTGQAEGTTKTIEQLRREVEQEVQVKEEEVARFKQAHLYETAEYSTANLQLLEGKQQDLEETRRNLARSEDLLENLLVQHDQAQRLAATVPGLISSDPLADRLAGLRADLRDLQSRGYTETHPEVRRKQRELSEFLAANPDLAAESSASDGQASALGDQPGSRTQARTPLEAQIDSTRREIERLKGDAERIRAEISMYRTRIERTPRVEQQLQELTKDYDVLREQYREYVAKEEDARAALRVEEAQQGERFEIVEAATPPVLPIRPQPVMVYGAGVVGGMGLFVGPLLALAFLRPRIDSESGLRAATSLPVLVTISRLETPGVSRERRNRILRNLGLSSLAAALLTVTLVFLG